MIFDATTGKRRWCCTKHQNKVNGAENFCSNWKELPPLQENKVCSLPDKCVSPWPMTKPGVSGVSEITAALFGFVGRSVFRLGWSVGLQLFCGWLHSKVLLMFRLSLFPVWAESLAGSRSSGPGGGGNLFMTASTRLVSLCPAVTDTGCDENVVANWEWSDCLALPVWLPPVLWAGALGGQQRRVSSPSSCAWCGNSPGAWEEE